MTISRERMAFTAITAIVIFYIGFLTKKTYVFDSNLYYTLSQSFVNENGFSFYNIMPSPRGYFFPFVLFVFSFTGNIFGLSSVDSILLGSSAFTGFLLIEILPKIFMSAECSDDHIGIRNMILVILVLLFWRDLIYYPISDIYACGAMLVSAWILTKKIRTHALKSNSIYSFVSGALMYGAYNTRTIYLFAIPLYLIVFYIFGKSGTSRLGFMDKMLCFIFILLGIIVCSVPEILINKHHYNVYSMAVMSNSSLFSSQLYWGMYMQRYETYIGDPQLYPSPSAVFLDKTGQLIIQNEKIEAIKGVGHYISLFLKYPFDFLGIYGRHIGNIFLMPFNKVYIPALNNLKMLFSMLNYSIVFVFGIGLKISFMQLKEQFKRGENESFYYLAGMLSTCVFILPGAIETRFFFPLYLTIYGLLAFYFSFKDICMFVKKNFMPVVFAYFFILTMLCSIWGNTFSSLEFLPQLLN